MKKRILFTLSILAITTFIFSQDLEITWQQCFGGSNEERAMDIIPVGGEYIIVGWTESNDGDISFNQGSGDCWIVKIDSTGNILWEKTYGGSNGEFWRRIFPAPDNCYYLLGASGSWDGDISYDPFPGSNDLWIAKIDSIGNLIWEKIIGGGMIDMVESGALTNDGGVVVFGWTGSQNGDISINYGMYDMWLVKLNSDGDIVWDKSYGTDDFDYGQAIIATSDGGFLIGGASTIGNGGNLTCEPFNFNAEAILLKLDSLGNIEWQNCYGGSGHDGIWGMLELEDGYAFVGYGSSNDGDLIGSGWHGEGDIWVAKLDFYGNLIWQKCYGGSSMESAKNILSSENNGFVIWGSTRSQNGDITNNHSISEYDYDIWYFKIDSIGELISQSCYGGGGYDFLELGVVKKDDNNYIIAATTNFGPSNDVACTPHGGNGVDEDWWVFEIKDCSIYAPAIPETPVGEDTVCTANNLQSTYTTQPAALAYSYQWHLEPGEAGTLTGDSHTGTVQWATDFEGTAAITVRSSNDCGESVWSQPHFTQVYPCIGITEMAAGGIKMKVYPNPAKDFVIFNVQSSKLGSSMFESSVIKIMDVYGNEINILKMTNEKTVWNTKDVTRGIYFYKIETGGEVLSGKIVVQ